MTQISHPTKMPPALLLLYVASAAAALGGGGGGGFKDSSSAASASSNGGWMGGGGGGGGGNGADEWAEWWTYSGISGNTYWGVINPAWRICSHGRHQSPIDVQPRNLVRDPTLSSLSVDKLPVSGVLYNTGQSLVFRAERGRVSDLPVNITGGPLAYR